MKEYKVEIYKGDNPDPYGVIHGFGNKRDAKKFIDGKVEEYGERDGWFRFSVKRVLEETVYTAESGKPKENPQDRFGLYPVSQEAADTA